MNKIILETNNLKKSLEDLIKDNIERRIWRLITINKMPDTIRLNKVLRELNISIDRVADFLQSKGLEVEKRPTAKISLEVYNILCDEFKIDVDKNQALSEALRIKDFPECDALKAITLLY